jgi:hypothetical protein
MHYPAIPNRRAGEVHAFCAGNLALCTKHLSRQSSIGRVALFFASRALPVVRPGTSPAEDGLCPSQARFGSATRLPGDWRRRFGVRRATQAVIRAAERQKGANVFSGWHFCRAADLPAFEWVVTF